MASSYEYPQLNELTRNVRSETDAHASVVALVQVIKKELDQCGNDPVKLAALSNHLGANADALAEAVLEGTQAQPPAKEPLAPRSEEKLQPQPETPKPEGPQHPFFDPNPKE